MRVLFLAPQPFYQERGTPIAVKLALEALGRRVQARYGEHVAVDLLTYAEGEDVDLPGVRVVRIPKVSFLLGVRPGASWKKLGCDALLAFRALQLLWKNRRDRYAVLHAVEESVFIAWAAKKVFGIPYIYDMDSSMALQLTEKLACMRPLLPALNLLERLAVRGSIAVAPVCDALEQIATRHGSRRNVLLRDVSLLDCSPTSEDRRIQLRRELGVSGDEPLILYVGNLERYQGIDLLLESFASLLDHPAAPRLAIIGGTQASIEYYTKKASALGCSGRILFAGPRSVERLGEYLACADILTSPRISGNNTPMKVYSYLHSGKALVATDLPTHQQVLDPSIAFLATPTVEGYADGLRRLVESPELRKALGRTAQERASSLYTREAFERQLGLLYDHVEQAITEMGAPRVVEQVQGSPL